MAGDQTNKHIVEDRNNAHKQLYPRSGSDGWVDGYADVSCVLVSLRPLVVAETCGDHITEHILTYYTKGCSSPIAHVAMPQVASQPAITASPST